MLLKNKIGLRIKILEYFRGSLKNPKFRGIVHEISIYMGALCLKRGVWADCTFKGMLSKKKWVVFLRGVDTLKHTIPILKSANN